MMMDGQTDWPTNRQTDKVITIGPPPTSSGGAQMTKELRLSTNIVHI